MKRKRSRLKQTKQPKPTQSKLKLAAKMLRIAARYIEDNYTDGQIRYDGIKCDG